MFLEILKFIVDNPKKIFRGKCFEYEVSDLKKTVLCVHKTTLKKVQKQRKQNKKQKKQWKRLKSLADSGDKISSSGKFLRPHFQNNFP